MSGKYKIKIGEKVFDADEHDGFMFLLKHPKDITTLRLDCGTLEFLGAKIEKVEPMRVEFEATVSGLRGSGRMSLVDYPSLDGWAYGTKVKVTVEAIPDQCEHMWKKLCDGYAYKVTKCHKCGQVKP